MRKTKNIWSNGKVWLPWGTCIVGVQGPVLSQDIYTHTCGQCCYQEPLRGRERKNKTHFFRNAQSLKEIASSLYQKREMRSEKGENKSKYLYYRKSNTHLFQDCRKWSKAFRRPDWKTQTCLTTAWGQAIHALRFPFHYSSKLVSSKWWADDVVLLWVQMDIANKVGLGKQYFLSTYCVLDPLWVLHILKLLLENSLVVLWLRLHTPNSESLGSIPLQGTRSSMLHAKSVHITTKNAAHCN